MANITLKQFSGMLPRYSEMDIPDAVASIARNCRVISGKLQPMKRPALLADFTDVGYTVTRVFKVVTNTGYFFKTFADETVDFVKAPITQDAYNRHYWTAAEDWPRYADEDMLEANDVGWRLGIPAPSNPPSVSPSAFGGELEETRVYVYTYVSAYGEESAPSPPRVVVGDADAAEWAVSGIGGLDDIQNLTGDYTQYNITTVNIYRTITGTLGAVDYFRIGEIAITPFGDGTGEFSDTMTNEEASFETILTSANWNTPPQGLRGLIAHPNGFLVGFKGRDIYMSVPYRPHAWPVEYILTTKWDIVGLGIVGQSIVVLTSGTPYIASGVRPEAVTFIQSDNPDLCTSSRGIISTNAGVIFPGPDGLMIVSAAGVVTNLTKKFISRRDWQIKYRPYLLHAAKFDTQYLAFYNDHTGFAIDFDEPTQAFIELESDEWEHTAIQNDAVTGDVWLVRNNILRVWNPEAGSSVPFLWRSKEYDIPYPMNFGALKIVYKDDTTSTIVDADTLAMWQAFNILRIGYPLNPLNFAVLNTVRVIDSIPPPPQQMSQQFHKGPLYLTNLDAMTAGRLTFRSYINREGDPVYETEITDMELYAMPTGFRSMLWQFEVEGTVEVQAIKVATTNKELMNA